MSAAKPSFVDILRAIDDTDLDVYEFRMWVHIWRVGTSWESLRTIAKKCNMSLGRASKARQSLFDRNMLVYRQRKGKLGLAAVLCSRDEQCSPDEQVNDVSVHHVNADVHHVNTSVHHVNAILSIPTEVNNIKTTTPADNDRDEKAAEVEDDPVLALAEHFAAKAGIVAGVPDVHASMYQDYWKPTLSAILNRVGGDEEMARAVVDASIAFCWGKGTNTSGKTYPLSNPHSIRNIYINRASELSAHAVTAEDETLWQRAIQAITRRDYSDERLKAAIRAIGGSDRIATANGKDTDQLRRNLGYEYRRISAPV